MVDLPNDGSTNKPEMSNITGVHNNITSTVAPLNMSVTGDCTDCANTNAREEDGSDE